MDWLKPTKLRVILTFIIMVILLGSGSDEFDSNPCNDYTGHIGYSSLLFFPATLIYGVYNMISCGSFACGDWVSCPGPTPVYISLIAWMWELVFVYMAVCFIVHVVRRKKVERPSP